MSSPPIGILTRNRHVCLDITLRSLSATDLPDDAKVVVFDDASDNPTTQKYYKSDRGVFPHKTTWPVTQEWKKRGLLCVSDSPPPKGIRKRVHVISLGKRSRGVVAASCAAVCRLFSAEPDAPGIFLLQDDVIFNRDFYSRMLEAAESPTIKKPLGVLAGIKLNHVIAKKSRHSVVPCGITAQCLYITRPCFEALRDTYFSRKHTTRKKFDDGLRKAVSNAGYWGGVIHPFVCQHFGVQSLVRPGKRWNRSSRGRVGYYSHPPYAMADEVREFPPIEKKR